MEIYFTPSFLRQYNKLDLSLRDEIVEKVEMLKNKDNHLKLKVHALHGELKGLFSFSVNYSYRIIFEYGSKKEIYLLKVGKHDIYK